ncbi:uncharacterized protein SPSK_08169 [Sporothrix schenckii 1099-18]|uniref:Uncharacterized protein n=1 Tax=Sporothrix schenckii 1099-18 TaxID=1397361 RepID=A0A0F2ME08_SPOSC|nr:uncharacterized protein SPSK_08169 [Sporothrix schenckii 1099-18]KJR87877.1 hypothetical protein SPSK_08169 [Sporothrix schenckii 1099-18]
MKKKPKRKKKRQGEKETARDACELARRGEKEVRSTKNEGKEQQRKNGRRRKGEERRRTDTTSKGEQRGERRGRGGERARRDSGPLEQGQNTPVATHRSQGIRE